MIIGIVGKKYSGKSTLAKILLEHLGVKKTAILSFATPLKTMIIKADICSGAEIYVDKTEYGRKMMQLIGTELIRNQINQNFWIEKMRNQMASQCNKEHIIIDDVRFGNEADFINSLNNNMLIRINRDVGQPTDKIYNDQHRSETEQDGIIVDWEIDNNGNIDQLRQIVVNYLKGDDECL